MKSIKQVILSILLLITFSKNSYSQYDSMAVAILDNMSNVINGIQSCSFTLNSEYDIYNDKVGLIKHSDAGYVSIKGPDKMVVKAFGDKGRKEFWYNGKTFTYYSVDNNQYSTTDAPPTVIQTINEIHNNYGIDFPAADIFYPYFTDDLIKESGNLLYLGITIANGKQCYHIAGNMKDKTYQFWISSDDNLPAKMGIVYTNMFGNPQYEVTYSDWKVNPDLSDSMFEYSVPDNAKKIKLVKTGN